MIGKTIDELKIGDFAEVAKTISESDIYLYAGVTGDFNPVHVNEDYAKSSYFKSRIAHGMLPAGLISAALGTRLPGPGTIYMKQELRFTAPVRIGDTVTAKVQVVELIEEKNRVKLKTSVTNQDGVIVIDGEALVGAPKK